MTPTNRPAGKPTGKRPAGDRANVSPEKKGSPRWIITLIGVVAAVIVIVGIVATLVLGGRLF